MTSLSGRKTQHRGSLGQRIVRTIQRDWQLWVLLLPAIAFFIVFIVAEFVRNVKVRQEAPADQAAAS